jgi:RimJ/RimL family protein N-acetyltransferase
MATMCQITNKSYTRTGFAGLVDMIEHHPDVAFGHLGTPRLILRRFVPNDLAAFVEYRCDPEVARYQSWDAPFSVESGERFLAELATAHPGTPGEWFQFAVCRRVDGVLIGDCAACSTAHDPRLVEIGFTFARAHQRRGYATEAVGHLLQYLFTAQHERPPAHRVSASCDVRNVRSAGLLERLGMRREAHHVESAWYGGEWTSEYTYAQLRREWFTQRSAAP